MPADRERCGHTPEITVTEMVTGGIRVIVDRVRAWIVIVDRARLIDDDASGLVVRNINDVIGDRAFGVDPRTTANLGAAVCDGLMAGGILPVIKHMPGHGRTSVNSHHRLPVTDASLETLRATDFAPFAAHRDRPWAMTAHMVYSAVDHAPATLSKPLIERVIRGDMGFGGVLFSDDLSMRALGGALGERAAAALDAGCDLVEHCNGKLDEMMALAEAVGPLSEAAERRIAAGEARRGEPEAMDRAALAARLDELLG